MKPFNLFNKTLLVLLLLTTSTKFSFAQTEPVFPEGGGSGTQPNNENLVDALKMLTVGLSQPSAILEVRQIYYAELNRCADGYYFMYYDDLIDQCKKQGIDLLPLMNASIKENYKFKEEKDYVNEIFTWFKTFDREHPIKPQIIVPSFEELRFREDIYITNPKLGYLLNENNWPLHCINCDGGYINLEQAMANFCWLTTLPSDRYFPSIISPSKQFYIPNCYASQWKNPQMNCEVCPAAALAIVTCPNPGASGAANQELRINLAEFDGTQTNTQLPTNCLNVRPALYPVNGLTGRFAMLKKIDNFDYFKQISDPSIDMLSVVKVAHPLVDSRHQGTTNAYVSMEGDILSLCSDATDFEAYNLSRGNNNLPNDHRFSNAYGVYEIYRPYLTSLQHLYFSFPWAAGMWYNSSPDVTITYGTDIDGWFGNYCTPSNRLSIKEDFFTSPDYFLPTATAVFGNSLPDVRDYLCTTDYNKIAGYWNNSGVTVGLKSGPSGFVVTNNVYDFVPGSPGGCTIPSGATIIQQFNLNSAGEYQIQKYLGSQIAVGQTLYIKVKAKFKNGDVIDENRCITVNSNSVSTGVIQFRGQIKDYIPSTINYQVTIYH